MSNKESETAPRKKRKIQIWKFYKVDGERVIKLRRECPRCGRGVFLAEHNNRLTCGKCGYTQFKKPS